MRERVATTPPPRRAPWRAEAPGFHIGSPADLRRLHRMIGNRQVHREVRYKEKLAAMG